MSAGQPGPPTPPPTAGPFRARTLDWFEMGDDLDSTRNRIRLVTEYQPDRIRLPGLGAIAVSALAIGAALSLLWWLP